MNLNKTEKHRSFIINTLYFALIAALVFIALKYVIKWVMPFFIGSIVALIFRPLIRITSKKTKLSEKFWGFIYIIAGYVIIGLLLWLLGYKLIIWIKDIAMNLPKYYTKDIAPFMDYLTRGIIDFAGKISPDIVDQIKISLSNFGDNIRSGILSLSADTVSLIANGSKKVPLFLISLVFTILSSLFISMDFVSIKNFVKRQMSKEQIDFFIDIRNYLKKTALSYLRAYLILMCITFVEVSVGLLTLRAPHAIIIALIIAIADAFPVLGTGTVVIPWAILSLFKGEFYLAAGLIILYLIVTTVRQFIEPKIIGDQLGLPQIVTILCIYLGFIMFGIMGAILFPITMNIIVDLQRAGKIKLWK